MFSSFVVLLNDFPLQGSFMDGLKTGISALHDFLLDMFVQSGNIVLGFVEPPNGNFGILLKFFWSSLARIVFRHVIGFAGHKPFEGFHFLSEHSKLLHLVRPWRLEHTVLAECFCSNNQKKLPLTES
jgi:hypothetical protein